MIINKPRERIHHEAIEVVHFPSAPLLDLLLTMTLPMTHAAAVTVGQIDTFEDGTTQNWTVALGPFGVIHPAPPVNIPMGGPAGADDNYLLLTALGGGGAGSRLSVINLAQQWQGDYLTAGVHAITMDVKNFGTADLALRLLVADPTVGPPQNEAFSSAAIVVPAGSGWTRAIFPFTPGDLTASLGTVNAALTTATELRIFHSAAAGFPGEPIVAQLGVDNITAVPVPASLLLLGSCGLTLVALRRKF